MKKKQLKRKPTGRVEAADKNVETPEDTLLDQIERDLEEDGITLFSNENVEVDYLLLPKDITETPSAELGRYLNAFTQQKMYTRTLVGRVSAMLKDANKQLDAQRDRIYSGLPARLSIKEKELKVSTDSTCLPLLEQVDYYRTKLDMLSDYLENIVDAIFNLSREISRRSADLHDEGREHNVGKRRR